MTTERQALVEKWRGEAERLRSAADEIRRRGTGSRQAVGTQAAHSFSAATFEACANDLEALSSSAPVETPPLNAKLVAVGFNGPASFEARFEGALDELTRLRAEVAEYERVVDGFDTSGDRSGPESVAMLLDRWNKAIEPLADPPARYKTGGYGAMVEDENGAWVRFEDIQTTVLLERSSPADPPIQSPGDEQRKDEITKAASALLAKLDAVHSNPSWQSAMVIAHLHGHRYDGPTYSRELEAMRQALSNCEIKAGTK